MADCSLDGAGDLRVADGHARVVALYEAAPDSVLTMSSPKGFIEVSLGDDGGLKGRQMQTGEEFRVLRSDGAEFQFSPQDDQAEVALARPKP